MNMITRPLDPAVAYTLSQITSWAAEELAARIAAKCEARARIGYSGQSASTYVDIDLDDDEAICVRISDHQAMSYNRCGDFEISIDRRRHCDVHAIVWKEPVYEYGVWRADFDENGEETGEGTFTYVRTNNEDDGEDSELVGYRIDPADLIEAVERAEAFVLKRIANA